MKHIIMKTVSLLSFFFLIPCLQAMKEEEEIALTPLYSLKLTYNTPGNWHFFPAWSHTPSRNLFFIRAEDIREGTSYHSILGAFEFTGSKLKLVKEIPDGFSLVYNVSLKDFGKAQKAYKVGPSYYALHPTSFSSHAGIIDACANIDISAKRGKLSYSSGSLVNSRSTLLRNVALYSISSSFSENKAQVAALQREKGVWSSECTIFKIATKPTCDTACCYIGFKNRHKKITTITDPTRAGFCSLSWNSDGSLLALGTRSGAIMLWSAAKQYLIKDLRQISTSPISVAFHPEQSLLLSSAATDEKSGGIHIYDLSDVKTTRSKKKHARYD